MNTAQHEATRRRVVEAIQRALPVDRDDNTVYLGSKDGVPLWGHPSNVVEAIATEVMRALDPAPPEGVSELRGRWSCGCDMAACQIRWDVFRDASADPSQVQRAICTTHALTGDSMPARVSANQGTRQRAQALHHLDLAHQEQCR